MRLFGSGQPGALLLHKVTEALNGITNGRSSAVRYKEQLTDDPMESTDRHLQSGALYRLRLGDDRSGRRASARSITGRTEAISFWNSIHGRTLLSASMSGLPKRKEHYGPIAPGIVFNPYPNCQHCPFEKKQESCGYFCLDFLQQKVSL